MTPSLHYKFSGIIWQHNATNGWFFVTVPIDVSTEIRKNLKWQEEGWGRLRIKAKIGESDWKTAIWYDSKYQSFLLPVKADIRRKENIHLNDNILVEICI